MRFMMSLKFEDKELMVLQDVGYTKTFSRIDHSYPWFNLADPPKVRYNSPVSFTYDDSATYTPEPGMYSINAAAYQEYRAATMVVDEAPTSQPVSRGLMQRLASTIRGNND